MSKNNNAELLCFVTLKVKTELSIKIVQNIWIILINIIIILYL